MRTNRRPNVLLLYTDQQRWDTIHYHAQNELIHTPNLDALAKSGALFTRCFCNSPVCMPSRQSMLSGLYPSTVGTTCNGIHMPEELDHLATMLSPYGYHTANLGKLHFVNHSNRDHRVPHPRYGFDTLIISDEPGCYDDAYIAWVAERDPSQVENCRCQVPPAYDGPRNSAPERKTQTPYAFRGPEHLTHTAFVADETSRYIRQHRNEPFFAIAGFYAPHCPVDPPQRFVEMYDPTQMPLPWMNETENALGLSSDAWRRVKAYYYALISHVDDQIGHILATLDACGLRDDTLILFTSDHGDHLGDHGRVAKGPPGYDSCARVPLLMSWPGHISAGGCHSELIEQVDVAPTILDYCGIQVPPRLQGRSFRNLLQGLPYEPRPSAYIEHRFPLGPSWKAVRTATHYYARCNDDTEILCDLESDPHQLVNLANDPASTPELHAMRAELLRRWFEVQDPYPLRTGQY